MTDEPRLTTPSAILNSIEAQLFVRNMKSSCDFYANKLGFAVEFIYGDPPNYGQVIRDKARLNLKLVSEPVFVGDVRKREHLLSASITVASANEIEDAEAMRIAVVVGKEKFGLSVVSIFEF